MFWTASQNIVIGVICRGVDARWQVGYMLAQNLGTSIFGDLIKF